jgi:hypothetical protein
MTFKGYRKAREAKVEWQELYLHLLPLVIEHPKILMMGGKDKVTQTINKLFKPSADFIGDASLNMELATEHHESQEPMLSPNPGRRSFCQRKERERKRKNSSLRLHSKMKA